MQVVLAHDAPHGIITDITQCCGNQSPVPARESKLEAKLEMMETQVIPKTAEEMSAKLKRKGIT
jgi:hypothetical protein